MGTNKKRSCVIAAIFTVIIFAFLLGMSLNGKVIGALLIGTYTKDSDTIYLLEYDENSMKEKKKTEAYDYSKIYELEFDSTKVVYQSKNTFFLADKADENGKGRYYWKIKSPGVEYQIVEVTDTWAIFEKGSKKIAISDQGTKKESAREIGILQKERPQKVE